MLFMLGRTSEVYESASHCIPQRRGDRGKKPSVKTLCCPLSAEFWRHSMLSGGTQRRAFPRGNRTQNQFTGTLCAPAP